MIELKEDDPEALDVVLRHLYKLPPPVRYWRPWRFWLDVYTTADKYLVADLRKEAFESLSVTVKAWKDIDQVVDIVGTLKYEMNHDKECVALGEAVRKDRLKKLLQNERYREQLDQDSELVWAHVDELISVHDQELKREIDSARDRAAKRLRVVDVDHDDEAAQGRSNSL